MTALEQQPEPLESELCRFARADSRCQALKTIFRVGPILACHPLAQIGDVAAGIGPSRGEGWQAACGSVARLPALWIDVACLRNLRRFCAPFTDILDGGLKQWSVPTDDGFVAAVVPIVLVLALLLVGVLRARANTLEPAFLRYQVWELLVGLVALGAAFLYAGMPHPGAMIVKVVAVLVLLVLLAVVLVVRKRRADASADDAWDF